MRELYKSLVSIIIPLYNLDEYLPKCLDSIIKQDYENIEILLINDGSSDNTEEICLAYSQKDTRIKYIKQPNGGVSSARNHGLKTMQGEYCTFIDGDDTVEKEYVSSLLHPMEFVDADMTACTIKQIHNGNETFYLQPDQLYILSEAEEILDNCECGCARMFKKSIIQENGLNFNEKLCYSEDTDFVYRYLYHCRKVARISKPLYNYFRRTSSASFNLRLDYYKCVQNEYMRKIALLGYLPKVNSCEKRKYVFNLSYSFMIRSMNHYFRRYPYLKLPEIYRNIYAFYKKDLEEYYSPEYSNNAQKKWFKVDKAYFDDRKELRYIVREYLRDYWKRLLQKL